MIVWTLGGDMVITLQPRALRWRTVLQGLTHVAHDHGVWRKDAVLIEGIHPGQDGFDNLLGVFASRDPQRIPAMWLYRWNGRAYNLVRSGS